MWLKQNSCNRITSHISTIFTLTGTQKLTQLCFLHEDLSESPPDPSYEGRQQHHDEALQVKLGRLICKHKQTAGDQQDHHDQEWVLVRGDRRESEKHREKRINDSRPLAVMLDMNLPEII